MRPTLSLCSRNLYLPRDISGKANPKSTTGRLDVFIRLITDDGVEFERVPPGYKGRLYAGLFPVTLYRRSDGGDEAQSTAFCPCNPVSSDNRIRRLDAENSLSTWTRKGPVKASLIAA